MFMGKTNAGKKMKAGCSGRPEIIGLNQEGEAIFPVNEMSCSVCINAETQI
jgi:hypothetical protein